MDVNQRVDAYLRDVVNADARNWDADAIISGMLRVSKSMAVASGNQDAAKLLWCYEQALRIQQHYLSAFQLMKAGEFYSAWCDFDRVEVETSFLERHFQIDFDSDAYKLAYIDGHTRRFQSLYPYKMFLSPAYLYSEKKCSICGQVVSPRRPCGHKKGEIYNGEMCGHDITDGQLLELSIVTTPFQNYSVVFLEDPDTHEQADQYDYSLIKYVVLGLRRPFDAWDLTWTKIRRPHSLFEHVGPNDSCPCDSGKKYRQCCLRKPGVLRPHVKIHFSVPPPSDLPPIIYT
jgi:SEC-C motif